MNKVCMGIGFLLSIALLYIPFPVHKEEQPSLPTAKAATISFVTKAVVQQEEKQRVVETPTSQPIQTPVTPTPLPEVPTTSEEHSSTSTQKAVEAATLEAETPTPSLIEGHYPLEAVHTAPVFDRTVLASKIIYPPLAKRQGKEALVMLRLFISETGMVERIIVEDDPGYGFADAAVAAFTAFQATPALLEGVPVPVTLRYPVRFTLR